MRSTLVLLLCISGLTAGEAPVVIPALELSFGGGAPSLAAPVDGWWKQSLSEAAAWWSERTGKPVTAADAACTGLRLVAGTVALPNGRRRIAVAGRWEGATPALAESVRAIIGRWPGRTIRVVGSTLHLDCEGLTVDPTAPPVGWRMVVRGEGLMAEWEPQITRLAKTEQQTLIREFLKKSVDLIATVDDQGRGCATLTTQGLNQVFSKPDKSILERLPLDAAFVAAIGINGEKTLPFLPVELQIKASLALGCTFDVLASALTGTWAVIFQDESHWLLAIPLSTVSKDFTKTLMTETPEPVPGKNGLIFETWNKWILAAPNPEMISEWKARTPRSEVEPGFGQVRLEWKKLWPGATSMKTQLIGLADEPTLCHWPLPQSILGNTSENTIKCTDDLNITIPGLKLFDCELFEASFANQGPQSIRLDRSPEGHFQFSSNGSVLPWLLPGIGLRWFADDAEDQEGRVELRQTIDSLKKSGAGNGIDLISNNFTGFLHTDAAAFAGSIVPVFASASIG